jgi:hypothetical protein
MTPRVVRFVRVAAALGAAALAAAPYAVARPATTAPGTPSFVHVTLTDRKLRVGSGASAVRGTWIVFEITNSSTSTVRLSVMGKTSKAIPPRHHLPLAVFAVRRGTFPLVVSLSRHRPFRQTFIVY